MHRLPKPTLSRLCQLHRVLKTLEQQDISRISSFQLADRLGVGSHSIRKDISHLDEKGSGGGGYDVKQLAAVIADKLGLAQMRNMCIVGLGKLGRALLNLNYQPDTYNLVAGFDSNTNRVETIRTHIPVYPAYNIPEIIPQLNIEIAMLTVPTEAAQDMTDTLINAGIRGILNFTQRIITIPDKPVFISNIDIMTELSILSSFITLKSQ
ncbi:MAG: redox-sensing transcriptional repressor Rex [candidate division KSB1 bacterium]|nr:redox-sensing transcriptional repressor Rex [candidate division KSB1 bacterium]